MSPVLDKTLDQRKRALEVANTIRSRRAEEKVLVRSMSRVEGRAHLADLLADVPLWLESEKLGRFLTWPTRMGHSAVHKILRPRNGLAVAHEGTRIGQLTERQREVISDRLLFRQEPPQAEPEIPTHVCAGCGLDLPVDQFEVVTGKFDSGWIDIDPATGDRLVRRARCVPCYRALKREQKRREKDFSGWLPAAPFAEWLHERSREHDSREHLAAYLGISTRTISAILNGRRRYVRFETVDMACMSAGASPEGIYSSELIP